MQFISLAVSLLYSVFVVGLCCYLLARGITHLFVILFAVSTILHALPSVGFLLLQQMPGGISAHDTWTKLVT